MEIGFEMLARDPGTCARRGRLKTPHGAIETPVFMPVGTQGTVKTMSPFELEAMGAEVLLGNAYHMRVRPGLGVVEACGGLHRFMGWNRALLTDSGGFQVFSLAGIRKVREDGVEFMSHVDGEKLFFGPEQVMEIQRRLGSDIAMVFDECPPHSCGYDYACQAVSRTLAWAAACLKQPRGDGQQVFAIVQGGVFEDLRRRCAEALAGLPFDGYAVGGVSVGEPEPMIMDGVRQSVPHLPPDKPRYLMGVGLMHQIVEAVALGVDMFDCVIPTRLARNGNAFTRSGRYPIKAGAFKSDTRPIEEGCSCPACRAFSRAYIRHLLNVDEVLGLRLLTQHNLHRFMEFMREIRDAIERGAFTEFRRGFLAGYRPVMYLDGPAAG
ncbi:MAG: tRNA guanosine(34) transglycosylase Tgt [Lentisphaerae bacterium]|nr:tRNA guanosine(34) transglycosylase Tgt [Lentisphaerota bacterium]